MTFLGKKRKVPLCLLAQLSWSHAQYLTCQETLSRSNVNGDDTLQASEIPGFILRLTSGIIDSTSIESLPEPFQEVFSSRANEINLLGISDPTATSDLLELDTFCDDVYGALGEYLGISITQNACIGALQTADKSPGNGRVSFEPEFLTFTTSLAGTDFGATTSAELPDGMIKVFNDFSGGTDVKSSAGLDYLVKFCQRTALQAKIEVDKPDLPETSAPGVVSTNSPVIAGTMSPIAAPTQTPVIVPDSQQPTSPPVSAPIVESVPPEANSLSPSGAPTLLSTGFILTDEFYSNCLNSMQASDQNGNNLMESSEFPIFIDGVLEGNYSTTPFGELDPLFQNAFNEMVIIRDSINIFGTKPGESPDSAQTTYLRQVCSTAGQAEFELANDGGDSTPTPAPADSVTISPAPFSPVDGLVSSECQAAIDAGGSWTKESYALFVQKLGPSFDGAFETLPYLLQDSYWWIMIGEDSVMIPNTPFGEAYSRFICDRTQRIIDQPEKGQTLQQQCEISLKVASSDGSSLSPDEYVVYLNHLSGFAWEGMSFDGLDLVLRDVFEEKKADGKVDAKVGGFCEAVSQALEITRTENAFYQRCMISLIEANANLDDSLSAAEYAAFFSSLDGSRRDAVFESLPDDAKETFEQLLSQDNRIQVSGLLALDRAKEDADNLRMICDSVETIIDPLDGGSTNRVTIFNAFVLQNAFGLTQRDLETGILRNTLENAYRNFVTAQFVKLVELADGRRKLSGAALLDDTIRLYRIEDYQCPSGAAGNCQRVFGSFDVKIAQVDSNISNEYSEAIQAAIDDGALQDEVIELDPDFMLLVYSSETLLRPDDGVGPSSVRNDNTVLVSVLTIFCGALFGMLGASAVAYYIVRKNLPAPGSDTNSLKVDPELAISDNFDMDYDEPEAASTEDPYGHLAVFDKESRSRRRARRKTEGNASEHSSSNNSEKFGFETYVEENGDANKDTSFMFPNSNAVLDDQDDEASINSDAMFRKEDASWSNDSPISSPGDLIADPISPWKEEGRRDDHRSDHHRGMDGEMDDGSNRLRNRPGHRNEEHTDDASKDKEIQSLRYDTSRQPSVPSSQQTEQNRAELDQAGSSESNGSSTNSQYDLEEDIKIYDEMQVPPQSEEDNVSYEEEYSEEIEEEEAHGEQFSEEIEEEEISEYEVDDEETIEEEVSVVQSEVQSSGSNQDNVNVEEGDDEHEISEEEESDSDVENENEEAHPPYRDEIAALMQEVMPDEMENLDAMLEQFSGREAELLETLENMINAESEDEEDEDYTEEGEDEEQSEEDEEDEEREEHESELTGDEQEDSEEEEEEEEEGQRSDSGTEGESEPEQADASESEEEKSESEEEEETEVGEGESEEKSEAAESESEEEESEGEDEDEGESGTEEDEEGETEVSGADESESVDESDSDDSNIS